MNFLTQDPNSPFGSPSPMGGFLTPQNMGLLGAAQGILQASGPSRMPMGFGQVAGQGLQGGLLGYQQGAQMQANDITSRLNWAKLKKELDAQEAWNKMFGGGAPATQNPMVPGPGASIMAGSGEAIPQPATQTAPRGPTLDQIGALGGLDPVRGKFALDHWKANNPDIKWEGGVPLHPRTGMPMAGLPSVPRTDDQGFSTMNRFDPVTGQFNVSITPGSEEAFRSRTNIIEQGRAAFDLVQVPDGKGGVLTLPRSVAAQRLGGGAQQPAPAAAPGVPAPGSSVQQTAPLGYQGPAKGRDAADTKMAEEYIQFSTTGFADVQKQIGQLREVAANLKAAKPGTLTGPAIGMLPRSAMAVVRPEALSALEAVEEVAQRNLRVILGGQFAEREGDRLIARVYNPMLPEAENLRRVERLTTQIDEAAKAKLDASKYFAEHGTIKGWKGKIWTLKDFEPEKKGDSKAFTISPETQRLLDKYAPQ